MLSVEVFRDAWPYLSQGLRMTLLLAVLMVPIAFVLGVVVALAAASPHASRRVPAFIYIDVLRAFPPLVLIIFIFYALPHLGLRLPEIPAFVFAMSLNGSAYFAEIVRAGLNAVPRGQFEAARSTGMSQAHTLLWIVLPQALRNVRLPVLSNVLELTKATSLASVVAIAELQRMARIAQGAIFDPAPLLFAALIYLAMFWPFVRLLSMMQKNEPLKHP
jgi:polar amino acid transport system permease protein